MIFLKWLPIAFHCSVTIFRRRKNSITIDFIAYALQYGGAPCVTGITDSTKTNRRHSLLRVLLEVYLIKSPLLKKTINKLIFIEISKHELLVIVISY